jgi:hypothetical protein
MKPKELLIKLVEDFFVNELQELGFKYYKSKLKFTRISGEFELNIGFSLSKWNKDDRCEFWTMWSVTSKEYNKWYKEQWGCVPANNAIAGSSEWNIPGWTRNVTNHFVLTNSDNDKNNIIELTSNIVNTGIPYYEKIKDWSTAAEYASQREIVLYDKVCDFYLISGQEEKAKEILEQGIKELNQRENDQLMLLPKINKRLEKYFY